MRSTPCTRRQGARVSLFCFKIKVGGFLGLDLKTSSYGLVIWPTKLSRRFLGLGLKTKRAIVCRLCHKINGRMKTAFDTHRDLAPCFAWNQDRLGFFSLASRLVEARCGWCIWHHRGGHVEAKQKIVYLIASGAVQCKSDGNTLH
jgi:hypothetical protein